MSPKSSAERQRERHERLGADSTDFEEYKKKDREIKRKRTELNPEELLVTQKRGKVATGRWRVKKMR